MQSLPTLTENDASPTADAFAEIAQLRGPSFPANYAAGSYRTGSVMPVYITMSTFHMGNFMFRICKINGNTIADEAAQLTEECFNQNILVRPWALC